MSAIGPSRTYAIAPQMSAFGGRAGRCSAARAFTVGPSGLCQSVPHAPLDGGHIAIGLLPDFHLHWHFLSWARALTGRGTRAAIGHPRYGGQVAPKIRREKLRQ